MATSLNTMQHNFPFSHMYIGNDDVILEYAYTPMHTLTYKHIHTNIRMYCCDPGLQTMGKNDFLVECESATNFVLYLVTLEHITCCIFHQYYKRLLR